MKDAKASGETKTPFQIIEDYLLDPMMYAGPERSLEALDALRASLTEKDREIERLKARDAEHARQINQLKEKLRNTNTRFDAKDREIAELRASLQAAEAEVRAIKNSHAIVSDALEQAVKRENAAIQRAEKAEANLEAQQQITRNTAKAANEARGDHFDAESALAAARKALEEVWMQECRCIGICACDMELAPKMRSIARAALNGDSHAGG